MAESAVFGAVLVGVTYATTPNRLIDWLAAAAVQTTFFYVTVADRLAELQAKDVIPAVACYRMATRYLVAKELIWVVVFVASGLYPPLIGSALFLLYPLWRRAYRRYRPAT